MKRIIAGALALLSLAGIAGVALAQSFPGATPVFLTPGPGGNVAGNPSKHVVSSQLKRIGNTTTYAGTTTAPVAICLFTSGTICVPMAVEITTAAMSNGIANRLILYKSTAGATGAAFSIYLYQAAPTLGGIFDTSIYLPVDADMTSGAYIGTWQCITQYFATTGSYYECASTSQSGTQAFSLSDGTLRAVLVTPGLYVPGSGENFNVVVDAVTSAP